MGSIARQDAWATGASMRLGDAIDTGQAPLGQSDADLTPQVVVAMMPQRGARLMEQERLMVLYLDFVLDVFSRSGEIALATAVASPDLAGRVLRESPGQDLGPDKRLPDKRLTRSPRSAWIIPGPPSVSGGRMCARAWEAIK
jgi:hypothetical protein